MAKREIISDVAWKVFDSMSNEEKKEVFLDEIEKIEKDEDFKKIKKYWDKLDEEKKLKYYEDWEIISVKWSVKWSTTWPLTPKVSPFNPLKVRIDVKDNLYEMASPLIRLWVSFWLIEAPKELKEKELLKNIKKDARRLRRNLWIFEKVCAVVPQLRAAFPIVKAIRPYAKWYEKHWAPLMQERIKNKKIEDTEIFTSENLSESEENVLESEISQKQAA